MTTFLIPGHVLGGVDLAWGDDNPRLIYSLQHGLDELKWKLEIEPWLSANIATYSTMPRLPMPYALDRREITIPNDADAVAFAMMFPDLKIEGRE